MIDKYETVFVRQLHINEEVKSVVQPRTWIPYHLRKHALKEFKRLVDEDIVKDVCDRPTPWVRCVAPQKDGGTRIYVDIRVANQAITGERHVMPTLSDFKAELNVSKYFLKIDLKQTYHQEEVATLPHFVLTRVYFVING